MWPRIVQRTMGRLACVEQGVLDEQELQVRLAREVLVQRRGLDAHLVGQSTHGQRIGPLLLENPPGRCHCLGHPLRARRWCRGAIQFTG